MVGFVGLVILVAAGALPSADCRAEGRGGQNTPTLLQRRITVSGTNNPVFEGDGTVLRHFVGLLGEDQGAVFSIVDERRASRVPVGQGSIAGGSQPSAAETGQIMVVTYVER